MQRQRFHARGVNFGRAMAPQCLVCSSEAVRYRFPCCRERYCSLPCYRVHSNSACFGRAQAAEEAAKRRRKQAEEQHEEEDDEVLSEVRLCALRGHSGVRKCLESEAFRDVLSQLDSAEDRREALEALLEKDIFFSKFVEHVAEAIDFSHRK
eukprot:TRINITY_DN65845_c0_g1_i1.p1 TRINITY_DN65845_c0_g1~~TRINITY_DN65845_c0_g1_i1.p1  ORF type:complete len:152 (+),score=26.88 TRINITY_DN65845_c0_g1_i1:13-468(+)